MTASAMRHEHEPVYRVVRKSWSDPLDATHSQQTADRRWNTPSFPALYCCCSERVARAVTQDLFRNSGLTLDDLQPDFRPQLCDVSWRGEVVDVISRAGVEHAGLPDDYPRGVDKQATRRLAEQWWQEGREGVCCRSASLARLGVEDWSGDHRRFGELAVFVTTTRCPPQLLRRRRSSRWLRGSARRQRA